MTRKSDRKRKGWKVTPIKFDYNRPIKKRFRGSLLVGHPIETADDVSTALGKVLLVSPLPRLECLLAAFHNGEHGVDDSGIVDTSCTRYRRSPRFWRFEHNDLFGITSYDDVRIMRGDDDLALLFQVGQDLGQRVSDHPVVKVVLGLIDNERDGLRESNQGQDGAAALTG